MEKGSQEGLYTLSPGGSRLRFSKRLIGVWKSRAELGSSEPSRGLAYSIIFMPIFYFLSWKESIDLEGLLGTCHSNCPHNEPSSTRLSVLARDAPGQRLSRLAQPLGQPLLHRAQLSSLLPKETLK